MPAALAALSSPLSRSAIFLALLLALLALFPSPQAAQAATFTVTKTADTDDGACDGDCSLREAIIAANANPGPDTITLPAGTYILTIAGNGEDAAATGDLDITGDLTITGAAPPPPSWTAAGWTPFSTSVTVPSWRSRG